MKSDGESIVAIVAMGGLGIIISYLLELLYDRGIFVDELVTGTITLTDLQIFIIIFFLIVGVLMAAMRR